jgi:hypothetical protein
MLGAVIPGLIFGTSNRRSVLLRYRSRLAHWGSRCEEWPAQFGKSSRRYDITGPAQTLQRPPAFLDHIPILRVRESSHDEVVATKKRSY